MRPLSRTMEKTLLASPSFEDGYQELHWALSRATHEALKERDLIESEQREVLLPDGRRRFALFWRRTLAGENLAIEISLAREGAPA